jgi:hypothetical protein
MQNPLCSGELAGIPTLKQGIKAKCHPKRRREADWLVLVTKKYRAIVGVTGKV